MSNALSVRSLIPLLLALAMLAPAVAAPKAPPAFDPGKPPAPEVKAVDYAAASRLLDKADEAIEHPERATDAQLAQAAHDLTLAAVLEPDLELQPWFHAHLGTVFYARAKVKRGPEHRYFLEKANVHFRLAALTHGIIDGATPARDVIDFRAAQDATASFILYYVGLTEYELGRPSSAVIPLDLLLAAAADHGDDLSRPEYVQRASTLLPNVRRAEEKQAQEFLRRQPR